MNPAPTVQSALPARGHHLPAAVAAALAVGLLLGLPAALDGLGRLAAVLVLQLGWVLAWVLATGIQGFAGYLVVGAATAVAVDLTLVLPERPVLGALLPVFGSAFLAIVLQQMLRRSRQELVASVAGGVLLVTVVAALGALLLLGTEDDGQALPAVPLAAVAAAVVVGHLVDLVLPRPRLAAGVPRGLTGLLLSVAAAVAVAVLLRSWGDLTGEQAALLGAGVGGVAALSALAVSYLVVEVTAVDEVVPDDRTTAVEDRPGGRHAPGPQVSLWALPAVQAVLPVATAAPVALGLQSLL